MEVRMRLPHRIRKIRVLPSGDSLRFRFARGVTAFTVPRLHTLALIAVSHA